MNSEVKFLLSPTAIRERCSMVYDVAIQGRSNFIVFENRVEDLVDYVISEIQENYPQGNIPVHSRWRHFEAGGVDRIGPLEETIFSNDKEERVREKLDLVIVSVLLDAGAGDQWSYKTQKGDSFSRSEGLGLASLDMFLKGGFADSKDSPLQANGVALKKLKTKNLEEYFQINKENPLKGLKGRVSLMNSLGKMIEANPNVFVNNRLGGIFDYLKEKYGREIELKQVLYEVLIHFGQVWKDRLVVDGVCLGDSWVYNFLPSSKNIIPFHKLSQWLTYSLLEPLRESGLNIVGVNELTGLAEYRNGGLLIDKKVLEVKDKTLLSKTHHPSSELIIEWRALTLILLDKIAFQVREKLNKSEEELPLANILQGGTWSAGRRAAMEERNTLLSPIQIESDGTVF